MDCPSFPFEECVAWLGDKLAGRYKMRMMAVFTKRPSPFEQRFLHSKHAFLILHSFGPYR